MKIVHLINPAKFSESSDLNKAQAFTFESIKNALSYDSTVNVKVATTQYPEDEGTVPKDFLKLNHLSRSVGSVNEQLKGRKLPLLTDIMAKAKDIGDFDYLIYSNIDIGLMPFFYQYVQFQIEQGHDAIIINRRRLKSDYKDVNQLPLLFSDLGKSHPGFDCFIFHKSMLDQLILDKICIGVPFSGVSLLHNLVAWSQNPKVVTDAHLTFHLGTEVMSFKKDQYYWHNRTVFFEKILPQLQAHLDLKKFPYADETAIKQALKWALNPSLMLRNYWRLKLKNISLKDLRWNVLQK